MTPVSFMNAVAIINSFEPAEGLKSASDVTNALRRLEWEPLPTESCGDEQIAPLFISVGYALTIWEEMDARLGLLFGFMRQLQQPLAGVTFKNYYSEVQANGRVREHSLNERSALLKKTARDVDSLGTLSTCRRPFM